MEVAEATVSEVDDSSTEIVQSKERKKRVKKKRERTEPQEFCLSLTLVSPKSQKEKGKRPVQKKYI